MVNDGYLLVLGILVPVSGLLLQWFTTRQLFTVSLIFSILGTFIAALAPSFVFISGKDRSGTWNRSFTAADV